MIWLMEIRFARGTASDKVLRDKAFNIAKKPKYDGYQRDLDSVVYKLFHKKTSGETVKNENISNKKLAEELLKPIITKFRKIKVQLTFTDNICGADLADMQLTSKFNKGFRIFICVIDILSKCSWVIPLKDKKGIAVTNTFQKILNDSRRRPNKIWVDKLNEFYYRQMKSWLEKKYKKLHLIHNEGKSVVSERFIRSLKNKIYKHMTSISKNVYIGKLDDIVNEYNSISQNN